MKYGVLIILNPLAKQK